MPTGSISAKSDSRKVDSKRQACGGYRTCSVGGPGQSPRASYRAGRIEEGTFIANLSYVKKNVNSCYGLGTLSGPKENSM